MIPAGANVYFGKFDEIVADQIMYLGPYVETKYKKATFKKKIKFLFKIIKKVLCKSKNENRKNE